MLYAWRQSTSTQMDSIWRMQVVRENATKRDIWKRYGSAARVLCCASFPGCHIICAGLRKVEQVSEEADHLKQALDKYDTRERRCGQKFSCGIKHARQCRDVPASSPSLLHHALAATKTGSGELWCRLCRRQVEEEERAELLARRTTGGPPGWRRAGLDEEAAVRGHVNTSKRVLEEAYQTGTAILGNMAGQRERLKVLHSQTAAGVKRVCGNAQH